MKLILFLLFLFWLYNYWRFTGKRRYYKAIVIVSENIYSIDKSEKSILNLASAYMQAQRYVDAYNMFNFALSEFPYSINKNAILVNMDFCKKPLPWSSSLRNHNMGYWHNFMLIRFGRRRSLMLSEEAIIATDNYTQFKHL